MCQCGLFQDVALVYLQTQVLPVLKVLAVHGVTLPPPPPPPPAAAPAPAPTTVAAPAAADQPAGASAAGPSQPEGTLQLERLFCNMALVVQFNCLCFSVSALPVCKSSCLLLSHLVTICYTISAVQTNLSHAFLLALHCC